MHPDDIQQIFKLQGCLKDKELLDQSFGRIWGAFLMTDLI